MFYLIESLIALKISLSGKCEHHDNAVFCIFKIQEVPGGSKSKNTLFSSFTTYIVVLRF